MRQCFCVLVLAIATACQSSPSGPVSLPLADAASIRIFTVQTNADWTNHIPLTTGYTVRLRIRLYTADGREIAPLLHPVAMSFALTPTTLATATVADSTLLLFDITPVDPPGTGGGLTITLTEPLSATTKIFGPFDVLVHPAT